LKGQGFFQVSKTKQPFTVQTENALITVLGTRFDVRVWEGKTRVIVTEGLVKIAPLAQTADTVLLNKNEISEVIGASRPTIPRTIDVNHALSWLEGKLDFRQTSLAEIIQELQRHYAVPISLQHNNLGCLTVTGSFEQMPVETVLASICLTLDLDYVYIAGKYIIMNKHGSQSK
jgi:transmembrane sensor